MGWLGGAKEGGRVSSFNPFQISGDFDNESSLSPPSRRVSLLIRDLQFATLYYTS